MSKVTTNYPNYNNGSISFGNSTASSSDYNMGENEAKIYDYALGTLAEILPQLNTFSTDTQNSINSQVQAYQDKGVQTINNTYLPMIKSLQNDIASRFGNLDNSIFKDNLTYIESQRSNAVSSFAQDVLAKQNELESNELDKRYSLVELLDGVINNSFDRALSAVNAAINENSNVNNYYSALYKALANNSNQQKSSTVNANSMLSNLLGLTGNSSFLSL